MGAASLKRPQIKKIKGRRGAVGPPPSLLDLRPPRHLRPAGIDLRGPSPPSRTPPSPPLEGHAHSVVEFRDCLASERIVVVVGFLDRECDLAFVALLTSFVVSSNMHTVMNQHTTSTVLHYII